MCCGYNPSKSLINKFIYDLGKTLDCYIGNYDNFFFVGDLNSKTKESSTHEFCNGYHLHSLCHKSSCYKNPEKASCIDFFLTIPLGQSRILKQSRRVYLVSIN